MTNEQNKIDETLEYITQYKFLIPLGLILIINHRATLAGWIHPIWFPIQFTIFCLMWISRITLDKKKVKP